MAAIVLPNLTSWVQSHVTAIYTATTTDDFNAAFNAFVAQDVKVTVNGKAMSRDQYSQLLAGQKFEEAGAQVNFLIGVEVPASQTQPELAGDVGTAFQATIDEKFIVLGAPETRSINATLNVVVIQDPTIPKPPLPGKGGIFDPRRVSVLNQVITANQNSILIPLPNPGQGTTSTSTSTSS